ncbi:MAG TPA: TonB-dependent receptor [Oligoflexus sp.]|uniref:TonB-dependent receptor n=1 Tax=Oligoflexus sp. TaxID=1971216 RepID=UPI002D2BAA87|nr:TonB-dependent receptor [Oligoflexus sp.]HYX32668.1 TonB-dependent receptor [Oligoflexus sp.]
MTASRVPEDVRTLPASVTIISRQDIEQVADAGQGLGFVLARLAPGMGPETNSVSNFGQQLQGRKVLILIDGIPQSENRQVSRQLNTIQLSSIQRIEIISGATAMYGADAIGGVINIITRDYAEVPLQNHSRVNVSGSDQASFAAGGAWQVEHTVSGTLGASHYLVNASLEKRASTFDAQGDLIPPEPAQTSRDQVQAIDALLKYAYDFSDHQRLELSFSAYQDQQDLDYTVATDPYRAEHGLKLDDQPLSERRQLALRYDQKDFTASIYGRTREYRFFPFVLTSPFTMINQSTSESEALGARLQWDRRTGEAWRWIYGANYETEKGRQKARGYDYTQYFMSKGLVYEPEDGSYDYGPDVKTDKLSPFLQTKWTIDAESQLHAGFRYEWIRQTISDFTPPLETALAQNYTLIRLGVNQKEQAGELPAGTAASLPATYEKASYEGGIKSFHASALNVGYSYNPDLNQQLYINYAQGYELADTARLMRDAVGQGSLLPVVASALKLKVKTTTTDDLDVATIYTQSVNAGYSHRTRLANQSVNVFLNQSDKIYRFNRDFSVDLLNQIQQVYGFETAADMRLQPQLALGGSYVMAWGRYRGGADDKTWLRLSTAEVNPPKLTVHGTWSLSDRQSLRAQTTQVFSQRGSERSNVERFRGYSTEDLFLTAKVTEQGTLRLGLNNIFNHDYKTVFHQWAEATYGASSGAPASGRRVSVGYDQVF